jgi:hypothetical protein
MLCFKPVQIGYYCRFKNNFLLIIALFVHFEVKTRGKQFKVTKNALITVSYKFNFASISEISVLSKMSKPVYPSRPAVFKRLRAPLIVLLYTTFHDVAKDMPVPY